MTLGANGHWLGTRTGAGGTTTPALKLFRLQSMVPWTAGLNFLRLVLLECCSEHSVVNIEQLTSYHVNILPFLHNFSHRLCLNEIFHLASL